MTTIASLPVNVSSGANLLDTEFPEWHDAINLAELRMTDTRSCVLGQLYGEYSKGMEKLGLGNVGSEAWGFYVNTGAREPWDALNVLWTQQVLQRRKAVA